MMNIIRADIYRILHGKVIYLTFLALIAFAAGMASLGLIGGDPASEAEAFVFTGAISAAELMTHSVIWLVLFILPFMFTVAGAIFMDKTAKNEISWGLSRNKIYIARLLIIAGLCVLLVLVYLGFGIGLVTIVNGFGVAPPGFWLDLAIMVATQSFMLFAASCFGVFLFFVLKSGYAITEVFILFFFFPGIVVTTLMNIDIDLSWILEYDLMVNAARLVDLRQLETSSIITAFAMGAAFILLPSIAGITIFNKAEIK
ncbi:MAG: hypothetical protein FWC78_05345 [Defluviitaleaceae bacterium]|nr:hypothetical protein [Defluviitaleaceae bacterium]